MTLDTSSRDFDPNAEGWRSYAWSGGHFDTAFRPLTPWVEGKISLCQPTIMAIVQGSSRGVEVVSDCGHRYQGRDFAGATSFIPSGVTRRIKMREVRTAWASLSIRQDLFTLSEEPGEGGIGAVPTFTNQRDPFLATMLGELRRLCTDDEQLDSLYCEAMAVSAAHYLLRRYYPMGREVEARGVLPDWRLRRAKDYVASRLSDQDLRLDDIAESVRLSTGFFHRAFKRTTGETPLAYIQRKRIEHAMRLLAVPDASITAIAVKVGFWSPSHFARLFRRRTGMTPSQYRLLHTCS